MIRCTSATTMLMFGISETAILLDSVTANIERAADDPDPEAVHKLRVSIRRLQQALRVFEQYFPAGGIKRVKKQLSGIMRPAGELRNRDIALTLVKGNPAAIAEIERQRVLARRELVHVLTGLAKPNLNSKWRGALRIEHSEDAESAPSSEAR